MASYNRVILIGNITREIELKYIANGTAVTEVGLAVNDRIKRDGEWVDDTTFLDVKLWGRMAEVVSEYCQKGSPLFVEGRLKIESWEKDGKRVSKLRVVGEKIQLMGNKQSSEPERSKPVGANAAQNKAAREADRDNGNDDIPF
jgi:single-strand DNA-binding protein